MSDEPAASNPYSLEITDGTLRLLRDGAYTTIAVSVEALRDMMRLHRIPSLRGEVSRVIAQEVGEVRVDLIEDQLNKVLQELGE